MSENNKNMYDALDPEYVEEKKKYKPKINNKKKDDSDVLPETRVISDNEEFTEIKAKEKELVDGNKLTFREDWNIWIHDINNPNWSLESYTNIYTITNMIEFWQFFNNVDKLKFHNTHIYVMKNKIKPLWEDPCNRDGGVLSFKVNYDNAKDILTDLAMFMIGETLTKDANDIAGLSISPHSSWVIIKIWNKDKNNDLIHSLDQNLLDKYSRLSIKYKPNTPEY